MATNNAERSRRPRRAIAALASIAVAAVALGAAGSATAEESADPQACYVEPEATTNAAVAASPTASYTAAWNDIGSVNDGVVVHSGGSNAQMWGTWSKDRPAEQWLRYDWPEERTLVGADIAFWHDNAKADAGDGVAVPASWRLEAWDSGAQEWSPVELADGGAYGTSADSVNSVAFAAPVTTTRLRAVFEAATDGSTYAAVAVSEFGAHVAEGDAFVPQDDQARLVSDEFSVGISRDTGGVYTLQNNSDPLCTNYTMNPDVRSAFDIDDSRWVGDVVTRVNGTARNTSLSDDIRSVEQVGDDEVRVAYTGDSSHANGIRGFDLAETYSLGGENGDVLDWEITIDNTSEESIEVEDLGFPMLMNSWWDGGNQTGIYEQNVARHSFVAKDGSYMYWQRPNGEGPYLVMVPQAGTSLEFKDKARPGEGPFAEKDPSWEGLVEYYAHSSHIAPDRVGKKKAAQYLPTTSATITPGDSRTYGFSLRWADDYADLRDTLYDAGVVDAVSLPGMTVPADVPATLAVRARDGIEAVVGGGGTGAAGEDAVITDAGESNGYRLFEIEFPTRGENYVTVRYGDGRESVLQYASIAPVEELIDANAAFLVENQQAKDPSRGYDGAFLQWDMATKSMVTRQNFDEVALTGIDEFRKRWMTGGSDDLGLSPAAFLAEKNAIAPDADQVASLDYYIDEFLLGYLQNQWADGERTWNIYHWYDGGDGERPATGKEDGSGDVGAGLATWRVMNSPHVWNTYLSMYEIARSHPDLTQRPASDYLDFAYKTAAAYFEHEDAGIYLPDASREMASMGELSLPIMRDALAAEGRAADAETLQKHMRAKYDEYAAREYPFASEMSIDTTAFESVYTLSREFGDDALARRTTLASLAARGTQPLWYFYGGDNRHMGESWWNLGYETQLGAWQQQDYLENGDPVADGVDPAEAMRSTYGAYLAGWANINTGQISDDPANYGAASWQFQSEKGASEYGFIPNLDGWWAWSGESALGFWGGLQTASVNVVDDPVVGDYAYGGELTKTDGGFTVVPRDGVRQRAMFYNLDRLGFELEGTRYTSATVAGDGSRIDMTVEGTGSAAGGLTLTGLHAGAYAVSIDGVRIGAVDVAEGKEAAVSLGEIAEGSHEVVVRPASEAPSFEATGSAAPRCVAGRATLVTTVTNGDAADARFEIDSEFGARDVALEAGKTRSVATRTGQQSIPSGEVAVDATGTIDGVEAAERLLIPYDGIDCG